MSRSRSGSPSLPSLPTYTIPTYSHSGVREESAELEEGEILPSPVQQGSPHESPQAVGPTGTQHTASSPPTGTHVSIENSDSQEEWWLGLDRAAIKKRWEEMCKPKCAICGKPHQPPHNEELLEKARASHKAREAKNAAEKERQATEAGDAEKTTRAWCDRCQKRHAPPCRAVHCTQCGQKHMAYRACPPAPAPAPAPVPTPAPSSMFSDDSIETLLQTVSSVSREAARAITRRWLDLNLANASDVPAPAPVPLSPGELSIDGFLKAMRFSPNNDIARAVARRWSELNSANANDRALVPAPAPAPAPTSTPEHSLPSPDSIRAMLAAVQATSGDQALATAIAKQWARDLPSQPVASNNPPTPGYGNRGGRSERGSRGGSGSRGRGGRGGRGGRSDASMRNRSRSPQGDNADPSRRERSPASRRSSSGQTGKGYGRGRGHGNR